jgi:CRP/FNR family cyclic AMP-dependent transcriptional regulator
VWSRVDFLWNRSMNRAWRCLIDSGTLTSARPIPGGPWIGSTARSGVNVQATIEARGGNAPTMYEELLARVPLFQELSRRELAWLGDTCREREYAPGDVLVRQGGGSVGLFILTSGSVRITACQEDGEGAEREVGVVGSGAVVGERTLLEDGPSAASVTAVESTRVVVLRVWDFQVTLREFPDLAIHLLAVLGQRLRHAEEPAARERSQGEAKEP